MKKFFLAALGVLSLVPLAFAQNQIPEQLLLTTGQYLGPGARAAGMAGTYTGIADDYSSIWWNPAGLAQIKRIELQGSLSRSGYGAKTSYYGAGDEGNTSGIRLNNVGAVFPVPVYQGALSFAFGYNQVQAFDRRTLAHAPISSAAYDWDNFDELETGRLGLWTFAGAVDVSPNLALGLGLNYFTGLDDYTLTGQYVDGGTLTSTESSLTTDLSAWGANFGGLFRAGRFARFGVSFQTPMSMSLDEEWTQGTDNGYFDYHMTYPAVFRAGASFAPGRWMLAADIEYRDWTSMEFRTDTPYDNVSRASANQQIKDAYRGTARLSVGGEYLFPQYGLRARAGYAYEPSPYKLGGNDDNRNIIAAGLGILVDRSVMLDLGIRFSSYTEKVTTGLTEDINTNSALVTVSYRM